ncbi:hypothetical protein GON09_005301 [Rhodococcus sp. B50]|nr:hypothetical protein [Rhodococcus sp. B50]
MDRPVRRRVGKTQILWTAILEMSRLAGSFRGMTSMPLHASSNVMSAALAV